MLIDISSLFDGWIVCISGMISMLEWVITSLCYSNDSSLLSIVNCVGSVF